MKVFGYIKVIVVLADLDLHCSAFHLYIKEADIQPLPNPKNIVFFPIVAEFLPKMQDMISQICLT
jgi:hypothetical protein